MSRLFCFAYLYMNPAQKKKKKKIKYVLKALKKKIKSVHGKGLNTFTTLFSSNKEQQPQMTFWLLSPPKFLASVQRPGKSCRHPQCNAK